MEIKPLFSALLAAAALTLTLATSSQAALVNRGGGMIYDTTQSITWLADMNYAKTSGYDSDGLMTWAQAGTWADNMVYGGFSDWRLPTMVDTGSPGCNYSNGGTDCGYNVQTATSEMAHLFFVELGNKSYLSPS